MLLSSEMSSPAVASGRPQVDGPPHPIAVFALCSLARAAERSARHAATLQRSLIIIAAQLSTRLRTSIAAFPAAAPPTLEFCFVGRRTALAARGVVQLYDSHITLTHPLVSLSL